jgi:CheY-like chemotaxis protein
MRALKKEERTNRVPIVVLTPAVTRAEAERALAAGCDGFMSKPDHSATLVSKVSWLLGHLAETAR